MSNESWYTAKLNDMDVVRTHDSDDFVVDYDKSRGMYRVTIFKDGHFWDEVWFDAYEEKEVDNRVEKIIDKLEEIKIAIKEKIPERRRNLNENGIEHLLDKLIDWIKGL